MTFCLEFQIFSKTYNWAVSLEITCACNFTEILFFTGFEIELEFPRRWLCWKPRTHYLHFGLLKMQMELHFFLPHHSHPKMCSLDLDLLIFGFSLSLVQMDFIPICINSYGNGNQLGTILFCDATFQIIFPYCVIVSTAW